MPKPSKLQTVCPLLGAAPCALGEIANVVGKTIRHTYNTLKHAANVASAAQQVLHSVASGGGWIQANKKRLASVYAPGGTARVTRWRASKSLFSCHRRVASVRLLGVIFFSSKL